MFPKKGIEKCMCFAGVVNLNAFYVFKCNRFRTPTERIKIIALFWNKTPNKTLILTSVVFSCTKIILILQKFGQSKITWRVSWANPVLKYKNFLSKRALPRCNPRKGDNPLDPRKHLALVFRCRQRGTGSANNSSLYSGWIRAWWTPPCAL